MNFSEALKGQSEKLKRQPLKKALLLAAANNPKASERAELALRNQLGLKPTDKDDYGALDWATLLPILLQLLPTILALFKK